MVTTLYCTFTCKDNQTFHYFLVGGFLRHSPPVQVFARSLPCTVLYIQRLLFSGMLHKTFIHLQFKCLHSHYHVHVLYSCKYTHTLHSTIQTSHSVVSCNFCIPLLFRGSTSSRRLLEAFIHLLFKYFHGHYHVPCTILLCAKTTMHSTSTSLDIHSSTFSSSVSTVASVRIVYMALQCVQCMVVVKCNLCNQKPFHSKGSQYSEVGGFFGVRL